MSNEFLFFLKRDPVVSLVLQRRHVHREAAVLKVKCKIYKVFSKSGLRRYHEPPNMISCLKCGNNPIGNHLVDLTPSHKGNREILLFALPLYLRVFM